MKKVLLNYLPPADIYTPSASLSILKSFLQNKGFETEVKYWNFLFAELLPKEETDKTEEILLPFFSCLKDIGINEQKKSKVYEIIRNELQKIDFSEVLIFGISSKFHQWVPGIILSEEIKKISPNTKIIVGGFGSKEAALEAMKLNDYFDFATWGEGEHPLLELSKQLNEGTNNYDDVPRLFYRDKDDLKLSAQNRSEYLDFKNYPFPDYDDYYKTYPEPGKEYKITLPINASRACCWNKCKFCDYNSAYKYRVRSPESIVEEIEYLTAKYENACFTFVDNDIFVNAQHFEKLLDLIIESIQKYNYDYEFWGEMIPTEKINERIFMKMQIAGFTQIFIGYDGISDSLLKKMNKSNSFSSNIFFVKQALKFEIDPLVNIIKGVVDETTEDVKESMNNLHFLRFFYANNGLIHDYVPLVISNTTKYFSMISDDEKEKYSTNKIAELLPEQFSNHKDRFCLFRWERSKLIHSDEWNALIEKEKYYTDNTFTYKISENNYREFLNGEEIVNIDLKEEYLDILNITDKQVCSFEELHKAMQKLHSDISEEKLKEMLSELKGLYLVYFDEGEGVVSVVEL